jgi:hypothetical protein
VPKTCHRRRAVRAGLGLAGLLAIGFAVDALVLMTGQAGAHAPAAPTGPEQGRASASAGVNAGASRLPLHADPQPAQVDPRSARFTVLNRLTKAARPIGSDTWSLAMIGIALALAVCGGTAAAGRRFLRERGQGDVQVVGRVSLSPKHAVYLLRAGRRLLLVGTGPQGAPSLISELEDPTELEPDSSLQGAER